MATRDQLSPDGRSACALALRVLVVEDSHDEANALATLLHGLGHVAAVSADAESALQSVENDRPDVVLIDIGLPGMDGCQLARRLRERADDRRPLLVALTGSTAASDQERSLDAGIDLHLGKPADVQILRQVLDRFQRVLASSGPIPSAGSDSSGAVGSQPPS